jgi:hypothetical protein
MIASFVLIVNLPLITIIRFIVWLVFGMLIYFFYSRHRSHLQQAIALAEARNVQEGGDDATIKLPDYRPPNH